MNRPELTSRAGPDARQGASRDPRRTLLASALALCAWLVILLLIALRVL